LTAVAVKVAVVAEAATVTLAGTVRLALLLVKVTLDPPAGAAPLKVTVQVLVPAPVNDVGLQVRLLGVTAGTVTSTTPPVAEVVIGMAPVDAETALVT
jgi:hypothetical protein